MNPDNSNKLIETINKSKNIVEETKFQNFISPLPIIIFAFILFILAIIGYFLNEFTINFISQHILGINNEEQFTINKHKIYSSISLITILILMITNNYLKSK